jgi:hypothetical protein
MNHRGWLSDFAATFMVTGVVATAVTLLWNLIAHGQAVVEWATSFRLAIILGIALPTVNRMDRKRKQP